MGRILGIDYGRRRCGLAVTDPMRIVASPLDTVETGRLLDFALKYVQSNGVDLIVVGHPTTLSGEPLESMNYIQPFVTGLRRRLPDGVEVVMYDERFTSTLAHKAMIDGGLGKKRRQDKALVDRTAATIILNDYLQSIYNK